MRTAENLLMLFLGLSCVFWLPFISIGLLNTIKQVCLFGGGFLAILVAASGGRLPLPRGWLGIDGFLLLLVASASGFFLANDDNANRWFYNYGIAFVVVTTMYVTTRAGGDVAKIIRGGAIILSVIVIIAFIAGVTGYTGITAPDTYNNRTITEGGFSSSRAGWSVGLALFFPVTFALFAEKYLRRRNILNLALLFVVPVSFLGSQLLCAGRTGLVASLISLIPLIQYYFGRWQISALLILLPLGVQHYWDFLSSQLRLDRGTDLSSVSTGRTDGFVSAWNAFLAHPFLGNGFEMIKAPNPVGGELNLDIHNLWLGMLADGGIFPTLIITAMLIALLKRARYFWVRRYRLWGSGFMTLITALICCCFEPAVLFGAFQNTALFWIMAGIMWANPVSFTHRTLTHHEK